MKSHKQQSELLEKLQEFRERKRQKVIVQKSAHSQDVVFNGSKTFNNSHQIQPTVHKNSVARSVLSEKSENKISKGKAISNKIPLKQTFLNSELGPKSNCSVNNKYDKISIGRKQVYSILNSTHSKLDDKKFIHVPSRIDTGLKKESYSTSKCVNLTTITNVSKTASASEANKNSNASRNSKVCSSKLTKSAKTVTSTSQKDRRKTFYLLDENKKKAIGRLSTVMEEESTLEESRQSTNETKQKLLISEAKLSGYEIDCNSITDKTELPAKGLNTVNVDKNIKFDRLAKPISRRRSLDERSIVINPKKPRLSLEPKFNVTTISSTKTLISKKISNKNPVTSTPKVSLTTCTFLQSSSALSSVKKSVTAVTIKNQQFDLSKKTTPVKRIVCPPKVVPSQKMTVNVKRSSLPLQLPKPKSSAQSSVKNALNLEGKLKSSLLKSQEYKTLRDKSSLSSVDLKRVKSDVVLSGRKSMAQSKVESRKTLNQNTVLSISNTKASRSAIASNKNTRMSLVVPKASTMVTPKRTRSLSLTPKLQSESSDRMKNYNVHSGKKQDEMRERLNVWLTSKGKTPGSFRHASCFHMNSSELNSGLAKSNIENKDETQTELLSTSNSLDINFEECLQLFQTHSADVIEQWLDRKLSQQSDVKMQAGYWVCRALVLEQTVNNVDSIVDKIVDTFEQAVREGAKPTEVISTALKSFVARCQISQSTVSATPQRRIREVNEENILQSSAVKLCVMDSSQFFKKVRPSHGTPDHPELCVITPVRRSTRKSIRQYTPVDKNVQIIDNLSGLNEERRSKAIFMKNDVLNCSISELLAN